MWKRKEVAEAHNISESLVYRLSKMAEDDPDWRLKKIKRTIDKHLLIDTVKNSILSLT